MGRSREPGYFGTLQGVHAWQGVPCSPTLKGSCQGQEPSLLLVTRGSVRGSKHHHYEAVSYPGLCEWTWT